jgi:hypothetical protein
MATEGFSDRRSWLLQNALTDPTLPIIGNLAVQNALLEELAEHIDSPSPKAREYAFKGFHTSRYRLWGDGICDKAKKKADTKERPDWGDLMNMQEQIEKGSQDQDSNGKKLSKTLQEYVRTSALETGVWHLKDNIVPHNGLPADREKYQSQLLWQLACFVDNDSRRLRDMAWIGFNATKTVKLPPEMVKALKDSIESHKDGKSSKEKELYVELKERYAPILAAQNVIKNNVNDMLSPDPLAAKLEDVQRVHLALRDAADAAGITKTPQNRPKTTT